MDALKLLLPRLDPNQGCTKSTCPASKSIYGYRPSLAATLVFLILFALSGIAYTWQGWRTKTKFFTWAMVLGSLSEVLGYVAKMLLWNDPFSDTGFKMSIVLLTFAPAFYAGGIYYKVIPALKHICLTFNPSLSRLQPYLYTWLFISGDILSIILQAIGGAISSASPSISILNIGSDIMIAGLVCQVFTLVIFGLLAADYGWSVYHHRDTLKSATHALRNSMRFKLFLLALCVAYTGISIRCSYRVAELAGGWTDGNRILREQGLFVGLDSVPVGVAAVVLNVWHPGYCLPREEMEVALQEEKGLSDSSVESTV